MKRLSWIGLRSGANTSRLEIRTWGSAKRDTDRAVADEGWAANSVAAEANTGCMTSATGPGPVEDVGALEVVVGAVVAEAEG